jgi:NADH-quinone oxidoreductase subunit I
VARWRDRILQLDLLSGLALTLRNLFRRPVTEMYPESKAPVAERYRGAQVLKRGADGRERCVGCGLCVAICPSHAIELDTSMAQDGGRRVDRYEIDLGLCIYCGFCQEVCPVEAVFMGRGFELSTTDPGRLKARRGEMLESGGRPEYDGL